MRGGNENVGKSAHGNDAISMASNGFSKRKVWRCGDGAETVPSQST
jgi:hypothetical protein